MMTSPRQAAAAAPTRPETPLILHIPATDTQHAVTATKDSTKGTTADMRSQTCVEFLHIMKEFSESSCDASETVQRVDSLVSQDEQLLRLFPLSRTQEEDEA
ncbi:Hypothetical protein PHPALM_7251, partial [Phytophthora palmivora]